jgi:hypothetical protein
VSAYLASAVEDLATAIREIAASAVGDLETKVDAAHAHGFREHAVLVQPEIERLKSELDRLRTAPKPGPRVIKTAGVPVTVAAGENAEVALVKEIERLYDNFVMEGGKAAAELDRFRKREVTLQALLGALQVGHFKSLSPAAWDLLALVRDFKVQS